MLFFSENFNFYLPRNVFPAVQRIEDVLVYSWKVYCYSTLRLFEQLIAIVCDTADMRLCSETWCRRVRVCCVVCVSLCAVCSLFVCMCCVPKRLLKLRTHILGITKKKSDPKFNTCVRYTHHQHAVPTLSPYHTPSHRTAAASHEHPVQGRPPPSSAAGGDARTCNNNSRYSLCRSSTKTAKRSKIGHACIVCGGEILAIFSSFPSLLAPPATRNLQCTYVRSTRSLHRRCNSCRATYTSSFSCGGMC